MNKNCFVCNEPAKRVCFHQQCDKNPFICEGNCLDGENKAVLEHTHNGKNKFLPYEQVFKKVNMIQDSVYLNTHINQTAKKIEIILGDIQNLIKRYRDQLIKRELKLSQSLASSINSFMSSQKQIKMTGKNISDFLTVKDCYDIDSFEYKGIEIAKKQMSEIIRKLQKMKLNTFLNFQLAKQNMRQARMLLSKNLLKESYECMQKAIKMNPFQQKYKVKTQQCEGWLKNGSSYFQKFVRPEQHFNLGNQLNNSGKHAEAIQQFNFAISLRNCDSDYFNNRGFAFFNLKQYQKAIDDYMKAIKLHPQITIYYKNRGLSYAAINMNKQAIEDFSKCISADKNDIDTLYHRSWHLRLLKRYQQSIQDLTAIIEKDSTKYQYYDNRASSYFQLKKYREAFDDYTIVIEKFKLETDYYYSQKSYCCYQQYEFEKGLVFTHKAIQINPIDRYFVDLQIATNYLEFQKFHGYRPEDRKKFLEEVPFQKFKNDK